MKKEERQKVLERSALALSLVSALVLGGSLLAQRSHNSGWNRDFG